jgi:hypothetical protein
MKLLINFDFGEIIECLISIILVNDYSKQKIYKTQTK